MALPPGNGAFVASRSQYTAENKQQIRDLSEKFLEVGHGVRADLVAQASLDVTLAIWEWCGVTQEQAIKVLTAQAESALPHQN